MSDKKINFKIKNKKEVGRELTFEIIIEKKELEKVKEIAFKKVSENVEIKGFRKGMAPEKLVVGQVGEMKIIEEQAYQSINKILPELVEQEKIEAITHPQISITKISASDDLELKIVFILMPLIELPDYKKIAKDVKKNEETKVSEKEVNEYIDYIRKNRAESEYLRKKTSGENPAEEEKNKLPDFNDEFVKSLGDFKNVSEFKTELEKNMNEEKKNKEKNRRRTEIIEKIIEEAKVDLPEILVQEELERMLQQYQSDIQRVGIKFEDYLKEIKKTIDDLKKEWHTDAVKRAKMNLILPKIAIKEQIKADQKRLEHEMNHIIDHHKDVNPDHARSYFSYILTNEAVFEFLENL
ncbi:MAG TPA: trigger factor [Candidatus Paceibacterota bacterium]|nr:trigger factor [Candidatus Paceibacterota bacterium]HMP19053.1 trigger factor [Candidatus Paceibacterota bacterium]HMP85434.1 trigger factor [Candidatus Paceibacterota bacterium]